MLVPLYRTLGGKILGMNVAIQGVEGSFHDLVAHRWFGSTPIELVPCRSFAGVFDAIENGAAETGVVAIENSLYGSISEVYDLLLERGFSVVGELPEHIHQQLIGLKNTKLSEVTHVYSHPVALNQCNVWLEANLPQAELIEHHDTADSVRLVREQGDPKNVAIASHRAAEIHELEVLQENIEDEATNFTRFLIIERTRRIPEKADKASLVLRTDHSPGALYRALGVFSELNINLTKLQSRPIRGRVWRYQFFVDVLTSPDMLEQAATRLKTIDCEVTILGYYRKANDEDLN
jgi:prephenate dehydratase